MLGEWIESSLAVTSMSRDKSQQHSSLWPILAGWFATLLALLILLVRSLGRDSEERRGGSRKLNQASVSAESAMLSKPDRSDAQGTIKEVQDAVGIASTIVGIAGAAVFFASGWLYESHWYGYYGLRLSETTIDLPSIMIQGAPGIMLLGISLLIAFSIVALDKARSSKNLGLSSTDDSISSTDDSISSTDDSISSMDYLRGVFLAYAIAVGALVSVLAVFAQSVPNQHNMGPVVWCVPFVFSTLCLGVVWLAIGLGLLLTVLSAFIALIVLLIDRFTKHTRSSGPWTNLAISLILVALATFYVSLYQADVPFIISFSVTIALFLLFAGVGVYSMAKLFGSATVAGVTPARFFAYFTVYRDLGERKQKQRRQYILLLIDFVSRNSPGGYILTLIFGDRFSDELKQAEQKLSVKFAQARLGLLGQFARTWQFWASLAVLILFLVSVSASALLGEYDARRGVRTLIGGWQLRQTTISSDKPIDLLQGLKQTQTGTSYLYAPLALVGSNDSTLYLVSWKTSDYFVTPPALYAIPRAGVSLDFQSP